VAIIIRKMISSNQKTSLVVVASAVKKNESQ